MLLGSSHKAADISDKSTVLGVRTERDHILRTLILVLRDDRSAIYKAGAGSYFISLDTVTACWLHLRAFPSATNFSTKEFVWNFQTATQDVLHPLRGSMACGFSQRTFPQKRIVDMIRQRALWFRLFAIGFVLALTGLATGQA